jgi:hypothetical protein
MPAREVPSRRRMAAWLVPLFIGLVALAALGAVLSSGSSPHRATTAVHKPATHKAAVKHKSSATTAATGSTSSQTGAASAPAAGGASSAGSPVTAVESFYHLAAGHQYGPAWALADSAFRSQLGGYDSFVSGQSGDRKIIFTRAQVISQGSGSATVGVRTISIRNDGTHRCSGTVNVVQAGSGWLLDQISINCVPPS